MYENEKKVKLGIMGCGEMGTSFSMKLASSHEVFVYDKNQSKAEQLAKASEAIFVKDVKDLVNSVEVILLAVKPFDLGEVVEEIKSRLKLSQKIISILAGTPLATLKGYFQHNPVLRMMPNLAVKYGKGIIGLSEDGSLPQDFKEMISRLFSPLGTLYWFPEDKMDGLTALTGSGPAFVFVMVEAMVDAAIAMGFPAVEARQLVLQMLEGSVTLLEKTGKHPSELKWQVSSPGGTTIEGLNRLEQEGVRSGIIQTFLAAYHRSQQISKRL